MRLPTARPIQRISNTLSTALSKPRSLQFTLTLRLAALITAGLSAVTLWTCWKTEDILIASHKQSLVQTAKRVEEDIKLYREMLNFPESMKKALKNRSSDRLWIGIERPDRSLLIADLLAEPKMKWDLSVFERLVQELSQKEVPRVHHLQGRDFVACSGPLTVNRTPLGTLYLAQDITEDRTRFYQLIQNLVCANLLALILLIALVAYEAQRMLLPLSKVSHMTQSISVEDLGEKRIEIPSAPREIQNLVDTFNRLLNRLSEAWQQQRTTDEQQRQFVSNVSHELRTPLTIVRGYLESVRRRGQNLTESQQEALSIASTETDHTIRVLQDLLDLARADDGYMPYNPSLLVLNDIAADVAKLAGQVSHRDIDIDIEDNELVPVYADAHRLKQVLVNLVENAVKYSAADTPVLIKLEQRHQRAILQVCDRGPGIPLKHQSRIFERFYRMDEARNRSSGGTGLGLALVKTFVEGMGGTVTVQSMPGDGSTFTVSLPIEPPHL
ncbi:MAG: HAMP domain-containing histidine kinase [Acaryochloridaceae cyanobacterium RU_4_10]|nr:HAMP domain-containing histidine kinase [Acaryochloridaceae cyanobacterium RU_4_10]